jgi:DNA repair exonuclease SbcCD ATPase subunit
MPHVSESLTKMSNEMARLSERTKAAEEHAADARTQTHRELEARIATAKDDAQRRRNEAQARGAQAKDDAAAQWSKLRGGVSDHLDQMRSKIDERRDDHDAHVAERRAEQAEENAGDSIDFAAWAVAEAEASVLEAADARVIADSLA